MPELKYTIEDRTIAELLGIQNFSSDESAILELVKNAYDAGALHVVLKFENDELWVIDDGLGMNENDITRLWMHVGKSEKTYYTNNDSKNRITAGSKGVGRFAIARLGRFAEVFSKKAECIGVVWQTDWETSSLTTDDSIQKTGTTIHIRCLRDSWKKRKITSLKDFLTKTYNDDAMEIQIIHPDLVAYIEPYFQEAKPGINCLSVIKLNYDSSSRVLSTTIDSDEFLPLAREYCDDVDICSYHSALSMVDEMEGSELCENTDELKAKLKELGSFSAELYFSVKPQRADMEKFLYKHDTLLEQLPSGIILYRNAFSISSYEGKKDWLGLGKRSRKSPAAATHETGSWRVRENQLSGKVIIDKKENKELKDLSNRQGLEENEYFELFIEVITFGINEFERYRQGIIRKINTKNKKDDIPVDTPITERVIDNPKSIMKLSNEEALQLASELRTIKKENRSIKKETEDIENRYKYDVRILNVLATVGLKASSIAHEMENNRNSIAEDTDSIVRALKEYGLWETLNLPENTSKVYKDVPFLLSRNKETAQKLLAFMNAMLTEIEKRQFQPTSLSIFDCISSIKECWENDYARVKIDVSMTEDIAFYVAKDVIRVILDNLVLNSIQQNNGTQNVNICISASLQGEKLRINYSDDGKGLAPKYLDNPRRILEVHETTRKNGHGLGMWIVNNTVSMTGGEIVSINGKDGFSIDFTLGEQE